MVQTTLPSVYTHFSDDQFAVELARVEAETSIEREWIESAGLRPFRSDAEIVDLADTGELVRISSGGGYVLRKFLEYWEPERSNPDHEFHYSPPYLRHDTAELNGAITEAWRHATDDEAALSITSLSRSVPYQRALSRKNRKLTISSEGFISSHQVGLALDYDACGFFVRQPDGLLVPHNPRIEGYDPERALYLRDALRDVLFGFARAGVVNVVEELPGTQEHVFHVAARPQGV